MNLFACEENVLRWSQADPESAGGIRPLEDWVALFSIDLFKRRLEPDYLATAGEYRKELAKVLVDRGMTGPWFFPPRE